MLSKKNCKPSVKTDMRGNHYDAVEEILEDKLEDLTTVLSVSGNGKSRLHEEVMSMVEKGLFKIALRRSSNVKSAAAAYLGINRNTFTDKMTKLGIECQKDK